MYQVALMHMGTCMNNKVTTSSDHESETVSSSWETLAARGL